jgi:hypothetical protein
MEPTDVTGPPAKPKYNPDKDAIFVMQYVESGDPMVAAIRAGIQEPGCSIFVTIDKMLARPEIQAGIKTVESITRATPTTKVTRDSLVAECHDIYERALVDRQYASATGAIKLKAALLGLLEQHVKVSHTYNIKSMTTAELKRIASGTVLDGDYVDVSQPIGLP